jgi:hypothetical protein
MRHIKANTKFSVPDSYKRMLISLNARNAWQNPAIPAEEFVYFLGKNNRVFYSPGRSSPCSEKHFWKRLVPTPCSFYCTRSTVMTSLNIHYMKKKCLNKIKSDTFTYKCKNKRRIMVMPSCRLRAQGDTGFRKVCTFLSISSFSYNTESIKWEMGRQKDKTKFTQHAGKMMTP